MDNKIAVLALTLMTSQAHAANMVGPRNAPTVGVGMAGAVGGIAGSLLGRPTLMQELRLNEAKLTLAAPVLNASRLDDSVFDSPNAAAAIREGVANGIRAQIAAAADIAAEAPDAQNSKAYQKARAAIDESLDAATWVLSGRTIDSLKGEINRVESLRGNDLVGAARDLAEALTEGQVTEADLSPGYRSRAAAFKLDPNQMSTTRYSQDGTTAFLDTVEVGRTYIRESRYLIIGINGPVLMRNIEENASSGGTERRQEVWNESTRTWEEPTRAWQAANAGRLDTRLQPSGAGTRSAATAKAPWISAIPSGFTMSLNPGNAPVAPIAQLRP